MNIFAKRIAVVAGFIVMTGVTVESQWPLRFGFVGNAEAVFVRAIHPVATVAVVETVAVSSANANAAAKANASAAAAATASANAAAASANAAAAAAKAPPPAATPAGSPPVGTIVGSLPPGCVAETLNNVAYQRCGSTYYAAAMMGNNLVFVVKQP